MLSKLNIIIAIAGHQIWKFLGKIADLEDVATQLLSFPVVTVFKDVVNLRQEVAVIECSRFAEALLNKCFETPRATTVLPKRWQRQSYSAVGPVRLHISSGMTWNNITKPSERKGQQQNGCTPKNDTQNGSKWFVPIGQLCTMEIQEDLRGPTGRDMMLPQTDDLPGKKYMK